MKRLLTIPILLLVLLGACAPATPTPTETVMPSAGDILTSVAQTVEAIPSQTPSIVYVTMEATPTIPSPTNTPTRHCHCHSD